MLNLYFLKIRKLDNSYFPKNTWEIRKTGKNWNACLGPGLFRQIFLCLFKSRRKNEA